MNFSVEVMPSLTVTVSDANIEAAFDQISTTSTRLSVSSNNATGYNTTISTSSASNDLKHTTANYAIPSITESVSKANIPVGHWGFSVDNNTYIAMPTFDNSKQLTEVSQNLPGDTFTDLYFATNIGTSTPSGTYTNSMLITVVPNYTPVSLAESYRLAGKTRVAGNDGRSFYAMQDMSTSICVNADKEESSIQAIDLRDNKIYWITKLKDGNCWMTQNLDFDITATNVTPELSDVEVAWNSSSAYPPQTTSTTVFSDSTSTGTYSYDPGDKYLPDGINAATSIDCSVAENKENCHYHVGNYYQWNAATAGTGEALTDQDAPGSICPKGWRLPTSNTYATDKSFGKLTSVYSITNNTDGTSDAILRSSPFFFTRSGDAAHESLLNEGDNGYYWSSRAYADTNRTYNLYFGNSFVRPNGYYSRNLGFSVRCVARGNDFELSFDANGGTNAPAPLKVESNGTSAKVMFTSNIPAKSGYKFLGWTTTASATAPDFVYNENDGTFTPDSITIDSPTSIYAVWQNCIYMQDVADWADTLATNEEIQVVDKRDNKVYWVTKLKDGNIWMTQNLDFDITPTNVTPELSDVTSAWNSSSTYAPQTTLTGTDYTQHFANTENTATYSYDPGDYYWNGNWISGSNSAAGLGDSKYNTIMSTMAPAIAGEHYHVGNYYQWNAATAGTGGTITNKDATSSICPKGWRLPTGGSSSGDYSLNKLISSASITTSASLPAAPFYFTATGNIVNNVITDPGYGSYYWTSSAYSTTQHAYNLFFDLTNIYGPSGVAYNHYFGFPVRCVARKINLDSISTMQAITSKIVAETPEGATKQLIDTRDNKLYWVTKLKDGNIWMTQNLDYDIKSGDNIVSNLDGTTSIWNTSSTYTPQATTTIIFSDESYTGTYSYDPGSNYIPNGTGTPTAITCTSTTNGGENCHYHQGNYYQYNAATAGTGGTIADADATSSICPKGWRLPTSNSYTENYSFGKLTNAYGITNNSDGSSDSALRSSPLFFARGGYVGAGGSLKFQGSHGFYWSSRANSDTDYAYYLYFNSSVVYPSYYGYRRYGLSVRCVAM